MTTTRSTRQPRYRVAANRSCHCGRICRGGAGLAAHAKACPVYRAYRAAYIAAIESGAQNPILVGQRAAAAASGKAV